MGTSTSYCFWSYCALLLLFMVSPEKVLFQPEQMKVPSRDMAAAGMEGVTEKVQKGTDNGHQAMTPILP